MSRFARNISKIALSDRFERVAAAEVRFCRSEPLCAALQDLFFDISLRSEYL